jgi:Zn-dependent protease
MVSIKGRRGTRLALSWRAAPGDLGASRLPSLVTRVSARSTSKRSHQQTRRLGLRLSGIPIRLHWSAVVFYMGLAIGSVWFGPGLAWLALGVAMVMLAHEAGHAAFARRLGYEVSEIQLFAFFGHCRHRRAYSAFEEAVIAWGGIAGQLLLLAPAALTLAMLGSTQYGPLNVLLIALSYFNAIVLAIHLIPTSTLDGAKAWRLPVMLFRARRTMRALRRAKILL